MRYALRGHLNHNDIIVALPGFFLRQTNPGDLVGRMQEIGVISPVEFIMFTHDVTSGGHASLTSFKHLHWRADQVTKPIKFWVTRAPWLVHQKLPPPSHCHPQPPPILV